ncbi:MAG TPA: cyclic pyranopterin monophosphate synthase MoaC [Thermoplasmata archaeon]|nr:cyclic pyranopterin monophosphate synthase MoaC [Thermoplasmata archaeon]
MAGIVDISGKPDVPRRAVASGELLIQRATIEAIRTGTNEKGDVVESAKVAALHAAKRVWDVLPHAHPIPIAATDVRIDVRDDRLVATVEVRATYKTGVEMEALYGCAVALLTVWDMVKRHEKDEGGQYPFARIQNLRVVEKEKG